MTGEDGEEDLVDALELGGVDEIDPEAVAESLRYRGKPLEELRLEELEVAEHLLRQARGGLRGKGVPELVEGFTVALEAVRDHRVERARDRRRRDERDVGAALTSF